MFSMTPTILSCLTLLFVLLPILTQALSSKCLEESAAILNEPVSTVPVFGFCSILIPAESNCTYDFNGTTNTFQSLCSESGGVFHPVDLYCDCAAKLSDNKLYNADYYYDNYPFCLGKSCNTTDVQEIVDAAIVVVKDDLKTQGILCDVDESSLGDTGAVTADSAAAWVGRPSGNVIGRLLALFAVATAAWPIS